MYMEAGVGTARRPHHLTLLTVDASHDHVMSMPNLMAAPGTCVITTGELPPTLPPTRCWLGHMAWPVTGSGLLKGGQSSVEILNTGAFSSRGATGLMLSWQVAGQT
jgi:hypothetical protein